MGKSTAVSEAPAERRGLAQYFDDGWSVPDGVHPFMSEVARLAVHRGINQERLAKLHEEVTGQKAISAKIQRHFRPPDRRGRTKRTSRKVVDAYKRIFELPDAYVDALLALDGKSPGLQSSKPGSDTVEKFIQAHLRPELIAPIFQEAALADALRRLVANEALATKCVNEAELGWGRHQAFGYSVELSPAVLEFEETDPKDWWRIDYGAVDAPLDRRYASEPWRETGISEELLVKWTVVGRALRSAGFDLFDGLARKTRRQHAVESLLQNVFLGLAEHLDWFEWKAIRTQLEAFFEKKGYPIAEMRQRLHADASFGDWQSARIPETELRDFEDSYVTVYKLKPT